MSVDATTDSSAPAPDPQTVLPELRTETPISPPGWLSLGQGEVVVWHASPSPFGHLRAYLGGLLLGVIGLGILIWGVATGTTAGGTSLDRLQFAGGVLGGGGLIVVAIATTGYVHLTRIRTGYVLTNHHVYRKSGIISRSIDPIKLRLVVDYEFSQSIFERSVDMGAVHVMTAGTGGADMHLEAVPHVHEFVNRLSRLIDLAQTHETTEGQPP